MLFIAVPNLHKRPSADVLILPFWQGKPKKHAEAAAEMKELAPSFELPVNAGDFTGKEGEALLLYIKEHHAEKRLLLLGLGEKEHFDSEVLRRAYAAAVKICQSKKLREISILLPKHEKWKKEALCRALSESLLLTNYTFDQLKGEKTAENISSKLEKAILIGADEVCLKACKKAQVVIGAVNFARDLVNGNADDVTPQALAAAAKDLQKKHKAIETTVLGKKEIEKEKLGLLLAVNRGASQDPALIILEYRGDPKSKECTAVIGKGITFDTGGLDLKPPAGMETMKADMSGAATILGTLQAAAELHLKVNLIGVIPATENAIGSKAYKPGDVYKSHFGKTVEISNTDAEGRLVLADAISYVQTKFEPTRLIDFATLTGGIVVALGEELTGLFSNNDTLAKELIDAGKNSSERLWRMPLLPEYKELIKSSLADLKNAGGKWASACSAAVFLQQFVKKEIPWAHLDIAGTAYLSAPKHYHQTPATGVGIRLLIELFSA